MDAPQFKGLPGAAANLARREAPYTTDMFLSDFPQFTDGEGRPIGPALILEQFISRARAAVSPDKWDSWRYACGLYTAHYLTLYLRTYSECSDTPAQAAASGATMGIVKSATLGDASVTYDTSALTAATEKWGGLNATQYGQLLATEARLVGMGGTLAL